MLSVRPKDPVDYSKCNQTVTVYHNASGTISKKVITGAFFDFKKVQSVDRTGSREANSFLLVIPVKNTDGTQPVYVGDKVVLGTGADITTASEWAAFIPAKVPNMAVISYVDPKYWKAAVIHWEAGG